MAYEYDMGYDSDNGCFMRYLYGRSIGLMAKHFDFCTNLRAGVYNPEVQAREYAENYPNCYRDSQQVKTGLTSIVKQMSVLINADLNAHVALHEEPFLTYMLQDFVELSR